MHRINTKKRRTLILRCLAYAATVTLSIFTTALLVYTALGYQFDPRSGRVVHNGLLLVDALPSAAEVYIDGQRRTTVPGRFVLSGGQYDISLKREGYRPWSKAVKIVGSAVETMRYPLLIPDQLQPLNSEVRIGIPSMASQSPDKKLLLVQRRSGREPTLLELKGDTVEARSFDISDIISGSIGRLKAVTWSEDSSQVLLAHQPRGESGDIEYISIPIDSLNDAVNVSRLYSSETPQQLLYRGNSEVYGINKSGVLKRYSLQTDESQELLSGVQEYGFSDVNQLVFVRSSGSGKTHEVGVFDQRQADSLTILYRQPASQKGDLQIASQQYDDRWYVTIALSGEKDYVEVYRDPLDPPILTRQLPFAAISFEAKRLVPSPDGQFLLLRDGQKSYVYDFEALRSYQFTSTHDLVGSQNMQWLTSHQILTIDSKQQTVMMDFDGANQYKLPAVKAGGSLYIDNKREILYSFTDSRLQTTSLLITKDQ